VADGLRRLDGVASVEVDLQQNLCTITPDPARLLAIDGVPAAVRLAGYRVGHMWIEATGDVAVLPHLSMSAFRIDGDPEAKFRPVRGAKPGHDRLTFRIDVETGGLEVAPPP